MRIEGEYLFQSTSNRSASLGSSVVPRAATTACWSPSETWGRKRPTSRSRSLVLRRARVADELGGPDPLGLAAPSSATTRWAADQTGANGLSRSRSTRLTGVVAGVEQPGEHGELPGGVAPPCPAGTAIVRVISSIGARFRLRDSEVQERPEDRRRRRGIALARSTVAEQMRAADVST